ncbi:hypothetical protein HNY73_007093 [Argiope bruennichi]|uniref:Endonuclease/exonuclease/phosphatase domain-containing protein n=1 Tax=Argiope bruennichi TaxID=94029 RepID=A0A8T0FJX5_ARGBR|nr:hypothetical protein HNY73_007093 [Argiope bruennichi]
MCIYNKKLNILQINLGRTKAATTHLNPAVVKLKTDILLVQEPYVYNNKYRQQTSATIQGLPMSWNIFTSTSNKAAIFIPQTIHKAITVAKLENTIAVKLHTDNKPITLISAYSSPIADINTTLQEIQDIIIMLPNENFLVGADLNGHNPLRGYHRTNTRDQVRRKDQKNICSGKPKPKKYMKKVKRVKSVGWKDLSTEAANPYGKHFKAAFRKTIHPSQLTVLHNTNPERGHQKIAQDILEQIFPLPNSTPSLTHEIVTTPNDCPFTEKEIAQVIDYLLHGKTPG